MINKIEGLMDKGDYGDFDFINFRRDHYWLDEKLDKLYPGNFYRGLIPTLDYALGSKEEQNVVWERILPGVHETTICPVLMCPDDCDFSCTLVVAEIINFGTFIQWRRLGIDLTSGWEPELAGTKVDWLPAFPELNFDNQDYLKAINIFKKHMERDRLVEATGQVRP